MRQDTPPRRRSCHGPRMPPLRHAATRMRPPRHRAALRDWNIPCDSSHLLRPLRECRGPGENAVARLVARLHSRPGPPVFRTRAYPGRSSSGIASSSCRTDRQHLREGSRIHPAQRVSFLFSALRLTIPAMSLSEAARTSRGGVAPSRLLLAR